MIEVRESERIVLDHKVHEVSFEMLGNFFSFAIKLASNLRMKVYLASLCKVVEYHKRAQGVPGHTLLTP